MKGSKQHLEKTGGSVNAGMILGYSRVTKRTRTRHTKTMTQTHQYKKTITRVYRQKIVTVKNGVRSTRVVTRVKRRTVTCTRKVRKVSHRYTSKTTVQ